MTTGGASDYPDMPVAVGHIEPVPRRVRAMVAGTVVLDTARARYVWEVPYYPQYYVPLDDVMPGVLVDPQPAKGGAHGTVERHTLRVGATEHRGAVQVVVGEGDALRGTARFAWSALDAWFEEDEQVFVHPRSPYVRVDALRSTRHVRVSLDGVTLAESSSPVMVFETGLPTRYYLNRTEVDFAHLEPTDTVSECPYKGTANRYWSVRQGDTVHRDLAWSYDFPTRQLLPIAGLVAFYNEKVDLEIDGVALARPQTHFS